VFADAAIEDGPNSAQRMLKLVAGLSMFPPEQQVVMVRAMDAADDTWDEAAVLEDARKRQSALRRHLDAIGQERGARLASLDHEITATDTQSRAEIQRIDAEIAELQQRRQQVVATASEATSELRQRQREVEQSAEAAIRGITHVINAFSQLMTFFGSSETQRKQ